MCISVYVNVCVCVHVCACVCARMCACVRAWPRYVLLPQRAHIHAYCGKYERISAARGGTFEAMSMLLLKPNNTPLVTAAMMDAGH